MKIDLNEEQDMLRKMSRDFLKDRCPSTYVREMKQNEKGYSEDLWKEITGLGWLGLPFPPQYGGEDGSFLDLAVLLGEMGRVAFPGPYFSTVVLGGLSLLHLGTEEQKKEYLPRICRGELITALALYEEDVRFDASGITLKATPEGEGYTLSGTKLFVSDANVAGLIILAARTSDDGITLFLVDGDATGMECTVLIPMDGSKQCRLIFNDVKVSTDRVLGTVDKGWDDLWKILELAAVAKCVEMVGSAEAALAMTAQHAKDRVQFGHPIGSYQAIQHLCANMMIDTEAMYLLSYQAAWTLSEGLPATKEVAMAKAWCADAMRRVMHNGLRVNGGNAVIDEHDLTLHYRKSLASEFYFGDARYHRKMLLDLLKRTSDS